MNIKKCPCLAIIVKCDFPENIGKVVEVIAPADAIIMFMIGQQAWKCHSESGLFAKQIGTGNEGIRNDISIADCDLKQINDPDATKEDEEVKLLEYNPSLTV